MNPEVNKKINELEMRMNSHRHLGSDGTQKLNFVPSISSGIIAPTSIPLKVGDIYVDTAAKKMYVAVATTASTDWIILN